MKVWLLTENWPPRVGGIENYLSHIAGYLPRGSVTAFVPKESTIGTGIVGHDDVTVEPKRFFWPLLKPSWLPLFVSLWRRAKREQPDILLCGKALFDGQVGYYLKKYLGVPYVVFTYALEIDTWAQQARTKGKLIRVLSAADRVVYINDETKQVLVELGVTERQLVKVWPGVDDRFFKEVRPELAASTARHYKVAQPYIVSVGRLIERKGFDTLIEAFAQLDQTRFADVQLIIVGEGPEQEALEELAEREFVGPRVTILAEVPDKHLPGLYAGAAVFALTPRELADDREGFGIVYVEAAAQGTPAVATKTGGAPEAVVHDETGLVVEPDNVAAVKDALEVLLSDTDKRVKLGEQARSRAQHEFQWSKRILLVKGMIDAVLTEGLRQRS